MDARRTQRLPAPGRALLALLLATGVSLVVGGAKASALGVTTYVAVGGSDAGNCQSAASPCATIAYAVSQASPEGTVDVGPGTFKTSLDLFEQGSYTIQGSGAGTAPATVLEPDTSGGAIFDVDRSSVTLDDLTIDGESGNPMTSDYGSTIALVDSTVTNSAVAACACGPYGDVTATDSTISGNTVGIDVTEGAATVDITSSTIAENGTGIEGVVYGVSPTATIVGQNTVADCSIMAGTLSDAGYNLDSDGSCGFSAANHSQSAVDPDLGPLQNNGGPTPTQAPGIGSPVLNRIPSGTSPVCPSVDQRGVDRPQGGGCDIGAVELSVGSIKAITSASAVTATEGEPFSYTVTTIGTPTPMLSVSGALPKGLTFGNDHDGTATISGRAPSRVGVHHLAVTAQFGTGAGKVVVTQGLTLTVVKA